MLTCPSCSQENPEAQNFCGECGNKLQPLEVREERKVITALFCDLVGSTALGERLDAEDISRLLHSYQAICRRHIETHGGVVEKFIGDAVVGVFGVPFAHEDDPERAVRAAFRIVEDISTSDELGIEIRIGVNTGEALVRLEIDPRSGVGFATGDTMNTAARLEAAAPVMGVAVGERTHRESEGRILFEELPPVAAKGKAEPVQAWRAVKPLARMGSREPDTTPFVGRESELAILTQLFDRSCKRATTEFVTIVADPGLGKSRLVRELARYVDAAPDLATWREGRCLPYGDGISFWALGEIVKASAEILETDDQTTISSKLDRAIPGTDPRMWAWVKDRLAPLVGLHTATEPPQQEEAFTAWSRFVELLVAQRPTVLVFEDLHWADPAFVAFLEHFSERTEISSLLVVVTARPELQECHPSWPPGRHSSLIRLTSLADAQMAPLVSSLLPRASAALTRLVIERAGGSPLYAEQLGAMLDEQGLSTSPGAIDADLIPANLQSLIAARIDALPRESKRVLMEASVVGRTFWSSTLRALGEHARLDASLQELISREFCRSHQASAIEGDAEFGFWHALVRDIAYAQLTKADRARLHAAVARWIVERTGESMEDEAEIVVHHLDVALGLAPPAPGMESAPLIGLLADALITAGEAAMRRDALVADHLLERALGLLDEASPRFVRALALRGRSLLTAGRPAEAVSYLERALDASRSVGDYDEAIPLAKMLGAALQRAGQSQAESRRIGEALLEELGLVPTLAKARLLGDLASVEIMNGNESRAEQMCAAGTMICEELDVPLTDTLLNVRGTLRILSGDLDGERDVRSGVASLLELGYPSVAVDCLWNLAMYLEEWVGSEALSIADEAISLCTERGVGAVEELRIFRLGDAFETGRWAAFDETPELIRRARETGRVLDESTAIVSLGNYEMERTGTWSMIDRLLELADSWDPEHWLAGFGGSLLARSARDDARRAGLGWLSLAASVGSMTNGRAPEVRGAIAAGDVELARRLVPEEESIARPSIRADAIAAAAALAEADGRMKEAAAGHSEAFELWDRLGYPVNSYIDQIGYGRCLVDLGQVEDGVPVLLQARASCLSLGSHARVDEIDQTLRRFEHLRGH